MKALVAAALLLTAGPACAAETRASLGVSVTVVSSCTVSSGAQPQCTPGTSWTTQPAPVPAPPPSPSVDAGAKYLTLTY